MRQKNMQKPERKNWADSQERLESLFLKEKFRKYLISNHVAGQFIIDTHDYTLLSNKIGCFPKDGKWVVYETDDRGKITDEREFYTIVSAYQDAASRCGLSSDFLEKAYSDKRSLDDYNTAIKNLKKVAENLKGTQAASAIDDDLGFLQLEFLKYKRKMVSHVEKVQPKLPAWNNEQRKLPAWTSIMELDLAYSEPSKRIMDLNQPTSNPIQEKIPMYNKRRYMKGL